MTILRKALLAGLAATAIFCSTEASARRTVIDQGQTISVTNPITACTIGIAGCAAITLPFSFNFGMGITNQAFVYNSGIVSFGAPIPLNVPNNASLTSLGVPVIAPLYLPGVTGVAGPYQAFTGTITPDPSNAFQTTLPNFGPDLFIISFLDPSDDDPNTFLTPYIHLILDASATQIRFEFIHGQSFLSNGVLQIELPDTTGRQLGYSLGNPASPQQLLNQPPDIAGINAFTFNAVTASAVPEPATWTMMLLGFGLAGLTLRRRRAASGRPHILLS
jgi:hypothetical protein